MSTKKQKLLHLLRPEDEPPEKKLISKGDIIVKTLSEKQLRTEITLKEELSNSKIFLKASDLIPVDKYIKGSCTLHDVCETTKTNEEIEKLKLHGFTDNDVTLYLENKKGLSYLQNKHKFLTQSYLTNKLKEIHETLAQEIINIDQNDDCRGRKIEYEEALSVKPNSIETKLLKFALNNDKTTDKTLPNSMSKILEIEQEFKDALNTSSPLNIKKIRKQARNLAKSIKSNQEFVAAPSNNITSNKSLAIKSKWDQKELPTNGTTVLDEKKKCYSCKSQTLYTIRNGGIFKIYPQTDKTSKAFLKKLNDGEIRKIPRFQNYDKGNASKTLFLKNLNKNITKEELSELFSNYHNNELLSIRVMSGKMRGQAFLEFQNAELARKALEEINGTILTNKPVIIMFGKG